MIEVRPGLWHWTAPHPEWTAEESWPREVSSYAVDDGVRLLLFDPLAVPDGVLARAADREPAIVLTAPWHERDARELAERLGARVYAPRPDSAEDLMAKFGVTREQAGSGSPDLRWLGSERVEAMPEGVEPFVGREFNDLLLWLPDRKALVVGDTLVDFGAGFELNRSLRGGVTRAEVVARLRPLLGLPVELVLPAHGAPTDRAALERILDAS